MMSKEEATYLSYQLSVSGGVLVITGTGEYSTGTIRSTPTAVPKRLPALWAKAIVLTVVTAVTAAVAIALSVAVALPTLHAHDVAIDLGDSETQRILLGGALYLVAIVPSCAFVRLSAGALATVLGLILLSRTCPGDPRVVPPEPQPVPAVYGRPPDHDHPADDRPAPRDLDRYPSWTRGGATAS